MWLLFLCTVLLISFYKITFPGRSTFYPPGPYSLPIIGNLISVWIGLKKHKYHHRLWQSWAKMYGDIVGLQLGSMNVVVVFGKELIKEVSFKDVFDGRPDGLFYMTRSFGKKLGIVFSDGQSWKSTRGVVLKYLKGFGYGTRSMETYIAEECADLVKNLSNTRQPVIVNDLFDISIVNILWRLVAGTRYDLKDIRLKKLCHLIKQAFKVVDMSGGLMNFMPFLRHIIPGAIGYTELKKLHETLYSFIKETIKEHQTNIVEKEKEPRDVIDAFLLESMGNNADAISEEELQVVCLDLLEAGMETVGNTAVFLLLHVVLQPHVQARLRQEVDDVVGGRSPALVDRARMVYTEAVIMEALRISSVAPVGIPHVARENTKLNDYIIPKGTLILLALHDLHNGSHWTDPQEFRPERFLTKDGNLVQDEWLNPFGSGKRRCIGEGLARSELFMFLTYLIQSYTLVIPEGDRTPSTEPVNGVTLSAEPFRLIFRPRHKLMV